MRTINLYKSYQSKLRRHGYNDNERFRESFVDAVNMTFTELNSKVFESQELAQISSFDDVIDSRLNKFTSMTFDQPSNDAIEDREYWSVEWQLERKSAINSFSERIGSDVTITIVNGTLTVTSPSVVGNVVLPDSNSIYIKLMCDESGLSIVMNDSSYSLTYSVGAEGDTITIADGMTSHVIDSVSGLVLVRTRFLTPAVLIYDFLMTEEDTPTSLTDEVFGYSATLIGEEWLTVYVEPSSSLSDQYASPFNAGINFHLQDGGEWSIEPENSVEVRWYRRGIRDARDIYKTNTTFIGPLGQT